MFLKQYFILALLGELSNFKIYDAHNINNTSFKLFFNNEQF